MQGDTLKLCLKWQNIYQKNSNQVNKYLNTIPETWKGSLCKACLHACKCCLKNPTTFSTMLVTESYKNLDPVIGSNAIICVLSFQIWKFALKHKYSSRYFLRGMSMLCVHVRAIFQDQKTHSTFVPPQFSRYGISLTCHRQLGKLCSHSHSSFCLPCNGITWQCFDPYL